MFRSSAADRVLVVAHYSALSACSSSAEAPNPGPAGPRAPEGLLALPKNGVQVSAQGTTVPAGADLEWCEVSESPGTPGEAYYVDRIELPF